MKLTDQCCTRAQAQRLKELGVAQESVFAWTDSRQTPWYTGTEGWQAISKLAIEWQAAFTVAELNAALGNYYFSWQFPVPGQNKNLWIATVICGPKPEGVDNIHTAHEFDRTGETQAQALATLLIAVLTTRAEKVEDVNNRLKQ